MAPEQSACSAQAFVVRAPAPVAGAARAALRVERRGQGMAPGKRRTCLVAGSHGRLLERGQAGQVEIAGDDRAVQRLEVDGRIYLIWVPPGGQLTIVDQPCFGWAATASWLDPFGLEPPLAYCRDRGATCRSGFVQAGPPGPVEDPLCEVHAPDGDSERRCVRSATIRVGDLGRGQLRLLPAGADEGEAVALVPGQVLRVDPVLPPGSCHFAELASDTETVGLGIGAGARWVVDIDERGLIRAATDAGSTAGYD